MDVQKDCETHDSSYLGLSNNFKTIPTINIPVLNEYVTSASLPSYRCAVGNNSFIAKIIMMPDAIPINTPTTTEEEIPKIINQATNPDIGAAAPLQTAQI